MTSNKYNNLNEWATDNIAAADFTAKMHVNNDAAERRFNNFLIENVACNKRIDEITRRDIMEASNVDIPKQGFLITYSIECSWDTDPSKQEEIIEKLNDAVVDLHLDEIYEILIEDVTPFEGWSESAISNSDLIQ
jgi:hypothetical protein